MPEGEEDSAAGLSELRISDSALEGKGRDNRGLTGVHLSGPQKASTQVTPVPPAKKSGLGRQFGRLGGAVSGKSRRNQ